MIALLSSYLNTLTPDNRDLFRLVRASCLAVALPLALPVALGISSPAWAEIYHCGDTWTNQPCPGTTPIFDEKISTPDPEVQLNQQKRDALHQMTSARLDAREKFGVILEGSEVEAFCQKSETTLEQCRHRIADYRSRLDSRVIEEEKLSLKRREVELAEKQSGAKVSDTNQVVIINNFPYAGTPTPYRQHRRTPTPLIPPYVSPDSGLMRRPPDHPQVPAPSRGEVPQDARVPMPGARR